MKRKQAALYITLGILIGSLLGPAQVMADKAKQVFGSIAICPTCKRFFENSVFYPPRKES